MKAAPAENSPEAGSFLKTSHSFTPTVVICELANRANYRDCKALGRMIKIGR